MATLRTLVNGTNADAGDCNFNFNALNNEHASMSSSISSLSSSVSSLSSSVSNLSSTVSGHTTSINGLNGDVSTLNTKVQTLEQKEQAVAATVKTIDKEHGVRIWSNGWCEQRGAADSTKTVTFLHEYAEAPQVFLTFKGADGNALYTSYLRTVSTTGFTANGGWANGSGMSAATGHGNNMSSYWKAEGYLPEGSY